MKAFPDAVFTYGNITKVDREESGPKQMRHSADTESPMMEET